LNTKVVNSRETGLSSKVRYDICMHKFVPILFFLSGLAFLEAGEPKALELEAGKKLFSDDFNKSKIGKDWKVSKGDTKIVDGRLSTEELPEDGHGAVNTVMVDFGDVVIDFDFELGDAKGAGLLMGDTKLKTSHAGHVCRVGFHPKRIELSDDMTGVMNLELRAKKDHPKFKKTFKKYLESRKSVVDYSFRKGKTYHINVQVKGDVMTVRIDGEVVGSLKSEGIGHASKNRINITAGGGRAFYDNLVISKPKK